MYKILVIEDHDPVRENIELLLTRAGYQTFSASNGAGGIKLAYEIRPDLIICDIMMPGMDGYDVLKQLGSDNRMSSISFIFLTAKTEMSDLRSGMGLGADDYLVKPFKADDLLRSIKIRLDKKQAIKNLGTEKPQDIPPDERLLGINDIIMAGNPPELLKISGIICITAQSGYSEVIINEGKKILVRKLLKQWEAILPAECFMRIHNSTIINMCHMGRVEKWFNNSLRIYMHNLHEPLQVSKRYAPKVKAKFKA